VGDSDEVLPCVRCHERVRGASCSATSASSSRAGRSSSCGPARTAAMSSSSFPGSGDLRAAL